MGFLCESIHQKHPFSITAYNWSYGGARMKGRKQTRGACLRIVGGRWRSPRDSRKAEGAGAPHRKALGQSRDWSGLAARQQR